MTALSSSRGGRFRSKEYHGKRYQVRHSTGPPVAHLGVKQCELCDVMVLSVAPTMLHLPRVTYIQAKYQKTRSPFQHGRHEFAANLVQWSLLRHRPILRAPIPGTLRFPKKLLSRGVLPSIGSFGVFSGSPVAGIVLSFSAADVLTPVGRARRVGRSLGVHEKLHGRFGRFRTRRRRGFTELESSTGLDMFVAGLHEHWVGSPVRPSSPLVPWLIGVLTGLRGTARDEDGLLQSAIAQLQALSPRTGDNDQVGIGAPRLLLVGTNPRDNPA